MSEALARLKLEYWYQVFMAVGAAGAIASLALDVKAVSGAHAFLIFLGMFFLGVGELINHPLRQRVYAPNAYLPGGAVTSAHPREPKPGGLLLDGLGVALMATGLYKVVINA